MSDSSIDYELIFVNDGSSDSSQAIIDNLTLLSNKVKSICFSRNFGHEAAMIAGIDFATGDAIICMDSDLQHPPHIIPSLIESFLNKGVDIITMARSNSKQRKRSRLFYKLLNKITSYDITDNASDFFLISKRVANILRSDYRERVRFLRGFIQTIGFKRETMYFEVEKRFAGESKYSLTKLLGLSITAIATLSKLPLKAGIFLGLTSGFLSLCLAIYSIVMKFIDQPVSGYTTIVVFLGFMFSIQFIILGIMGEYIGFIFDEQKKRPIYIVDKTTNLNTADKQ